MAESTEAEVIKQFIPSLVTAVCDSVQGVSDKCLAKGLISESTSKRVLDPRGGTNEERARSLIHSVHTSTKTDPSCFQIFLEVLEEELPYRVKEKIVTEMKKELTERNEMCKAVVPVSQASRPMSLDRRLECIQQQSLFLNKYEDAISKCASASTEKSLIEETLQSKYKECGRLRASLDDLDQDCDDKKITKSRQRLAVCEMEVFELRGRIENLEVIIEEETMRAKRGRNTIRVETKRLLEQFTRQSREQFSMILEGREQVYKQSLEDKESEVRQKMEREKKDLKQEMNLKVKDLEHKLALQDKELKIKELELKHAESEVDPTSRRRKVSTKSFRLPDHSQSASRPKAFSATGPVRITRHGPQQSVTPSTSANTTLVLGTEHFPSLLQQLHEHAAKWRDIGGALGFTQGELDTIQHLHSLIFQRGDSVSCLINMLSDWLQWAPGDGRGSTEFATLDVLKAALRNVGLGATAETLFV